MMTNPHDNGGPAFPNPALADEGFMARPEDAGMTLRDWFAGQALAGYFAYTHTPHMNAADRETADYCYRTADAMIAARNAKD